jgi:NAD+ synthase (glutamine-hydrolysing)
MKIALAQLNYTIADIVGNSEKIIVAAQKAKESGVELVVFSELSICGYSPDDLLDYKHFVKECIDAVHNIAKHAHGITIVLGAPTLNENEHGRRLFNSACILQDGIIKETVHKTLLPTYDIFNESRYFEENSVFKTIEVNGKKIAITICEDLWYEMERFKYLENPLAKLNKLNPDLVINISASPFNINKKTERFKVLQKASKDIGLPLIYVNQTGVHTDIVFDGNSMVLDSNGRLILELESFKEDFKIFDTEKTYHKLVFKERENIELVHDALIYGIQNFFQKMGFSKAILGSSGGIDSAVVQALATRALGAENVKAILMPSDFSSEGSVLDAKHLSENLGNSFEILSISNVFDSFGETLKPMFEGLDFGLAEENIQARSRAVLLMAISNKFGHILLNTSNKSEMSVGYTTLYGDMCGSLSVMGDVYKTDVYKLASYINKDNEIIPNSIINKAPSAELRPNQKDSDSLPEYSILDAILELYIEHQKGIETIVEKGFERPLVERIIGLVNRNEYKRFQAPPIIRVGSKAFGRGRQIPLVSKW